MVNNSEHGTGRSRRFRSATRTTFAASLLLISFISLLAFVSHATKSPGPSDQLWHQNDTMGSVFGLVWFLAGLSATALSKTLHSPARQLVLIGGGILTLLSILFWFTFAASM